MAYFHNALHSFTTVGNSRYLRMCLPVCIEYIEDREMINSESLATATILGPTSFMILFIETTKLEEMEQWIKYINLGVEPF